MDLNDRRHYPVAQTLLDGIGAKGSWSDAVCVGPFVWIAGQPGWDKRTGELPAGLEAQAEQAFENGKEVLERVGATLADVVQLRAFLERAEYYPRYQAVYQRHFPEDQPVRTSVVSSHVYPDMLIDFDVVAVKRSAA